MIKNIIFDFGGVLVDWNPHYLYDPYFGDSQKAEWFLSHICTYEWNAQHDKGKPIAEGTAELTAQYPEWAKEIAMYYECFPQMIRGEIEGMRAYIADLKQKGYRIYGLSNWSTETFAMIRNNYPIFDMIEEAVISGREYVMKPDPAIFHLALSRFGIEAGESLFIDDNAANIAAAQACGIHAHLFQGPHSLPTIEELCHGA